MRKIAVRAKPDHALKSRSDAQQCTGVKQGRTEAMRPFAQQSLAAARASVISIRPRLRSPLDAADVGGSASTAKCRRPPWMAGVRATQGAVAEMRGRVMWSRGAGSGPAFGHAWPRTIKRVRGPLQVLHLQHPSYIRLCWPHGHLPMRSKSTTSDAL